MWSKTLPAQGQHTLLAPGEKRFCSSGWLDCNSARRVKQGLSAGIAAQYLRGYKQRIDECLFRPCKLYIMGCNQSRAKKEVAA